MHTAEPGVLHGLRVSAFPYTLLPTKRVRVGRPSVHEVAPIGEKESAAVRASDSESASRESTGAPLSSASGSSQAQLKLVRRSLIGSARLERCRGDRRSGRSVCGGPVFWEDATVLGLRRGVLLGYPGALFPGDLRTLLPPSLFPCMARRGSLQMGRIKIPTGSAPHPPAPAHKITRGRF